MEDLVGDGRFGGGREIWLEMGDLVGEMEEDSAWSRSFDGGQGVAMSDDRKDTS